MTDQDPQTWFENIWALREDTLYRSYFGDLGPGIYNLTPKSFANIGIHDPDPRFLTHGIFECPPSDKHPDFIYVSSGMSNAWGATPDTADPAGFSGLGCEFTLHTPARQRWAIELLHWIMAVQLAVACGILQGQDHSHDKGPQREAGGGGDEGGGLLHRHDRLSIGSGIPTQSRPGL
ncbi:MAG TPA: suppressor of fused domain protein, partial [Phycisphaerae bacterium]